MKRIVLITALLIPACGYSPEDNDTITTERHCDDCTDSRSQTEPYKPQYPQSPIDIDVDVDVDTSNCCEQQKDCYEPCPKPQPEPPCNDRECDDPCQEPTNNQPVINVEACDPNTANCNINVNNNNNRVCINR